MDVIRPSLARRGLAEFEAHAIELLQQDIKTLHYGSQREIMRQVRGLVEAYGAGACDIAPTQHHVLAQGCVVAHVPQAYLQHNKY
jgi:hypothetical protein